MEQQFSFAQLPQNLSQLQALPEAAMTNPFAVAALTVAAFCRYGTDRDACLEMLNFLRGPRPLLPYDMQFLRDRLGGKEYKPFSFFCRCSTRQQLYTVSTVCDHNFGRGQRFDARG